MYKATDTVPYSSGFLLKIQYRTCSISNNRYGTVPVATALLLMSFVPMFPLYVNFTLHDNSQCYVRLAKNNELSASALSVGGIYDVTGGMAGTLPALYCWKTPAFIWYPAFNQDLVFIRTWNSNSDVY